MKRSEVESTILRRIGTLISGLGLDTQPGGASDLIEEALWRALAELDLPPAAPLVVSDADLAAVPASRLAALLDLTELGVLEACAAAAAVLVDTQAGERRDSFSQMRTAIEGLIARKQVAIERRYPDLTSRRTLRPGRIDLVQSQRMHWSDL